MTLEIFFEKFVCFTEAPDAVPNIKRIVRRLAVRGRLVPQDPNDEHASAGLKAADVDLERWIVAYDEHRHPVPKTWTWMRFGGVGDQRLGKMLDRQKNRGEPRPYLRNTNVQWMRFDLDDVKQMRVEKVEENQLRLMKDDLLICEGGEPGRCAVWNDQVADMYFQKALHRVRPCSAILSQFLALNFQVDSENGVLATLFTGATIKHLTGRSLSQYLIPIPPLAEQWRIVTKVNELVALCDRLEVQQQERETRHAALARASLDRFADAPTSANLNFLFDGSYPIAPAELRKAILTLAVQGKLVPQDPNDEPAGEIIKRIDMEKGCLADDWVTKRSSELHRQEVMPEPVGLASGWISTALSDLCTSITDGDHLPPPQTDDGIPFLVISDVRWGGIDFMACRYVPEEYFSKLDPIRKPKAGDILYTLVGSFGIPVIVDIERPFCVQRHIAIIRPSKSVSIKYVAFLLESDLVLKQAAAIATGIAQKTVPLSGLRRIRVPLPPLAEQRRIVAKIDQLMTLVDRLAEQLEASRETGEELVEALVADLIPQE
ncbi:MAG TPA: restriction endonuclease subunit S [Terriglobia bacterium]|jgi:type I restriction enzyme S subunit